MWEKIEIESSECEEQGSVVLSYLGEATGDLIKLPGHSNTPTHGGPTLVIHNGYNG